MFKDNKSLVIIAIILTILVLPETNMHRKEVAKGRVFDVVKLVKAIADEDIGTTLLLSLLYAFAFSLFIYAYQPFAVKILGMTTQLISINFTILGIVGLIAQILIIPRITKKIGELKALTMSLIGLSVSFAAMFFSRSMMVFGTISILYALSNSFVNPLIQTILSKETDEKSQGSILGLGASYISIGTIFGPIVGGLIATLNVPLPILAASITAALCALLSIHIHRKYHRKQSAF